MNVELGKQLLQCIKQKHNEGTLIEWTWFLRVDDHIVLHIRDAILYGENFTHACAAGWLAYTNLERAKEYFEEHSCINSVTVMEEFVESMLGIERYQMRLLVYTDAPEDMIKVLEEMLLANTVT